ncbi:SDR family NAD(P)-dependent oxidoreductase [Patulibacter americanus]|uniref:SDR family NAD(P)-dependent oxidoreductase n=1 Tax=Patulibacter americanus TaxID=588672 RepID=UPI0003B7B5B2|nr:SDR family NAD(P)-dependent oxidoreductase [Patulibacter americanus]
MQPQRIVITGGSSGIGRAVAERCARDGARVGLVARDRTRLEAAAKAAGAEASEAADVSRSAELLPALDRLRTALGGVDAVVVNAGGTGIVGTETAPADAEGTWDAVLGQNLTGAFLTVLGLARHLPRPGGRIVLLSSIAGAVGGPVGSLAYAAAKAGTDGLTRALAAELGPQGIAVNAIAPGYIAHTRFFGEGDQAERRDRFAALIPSGRVGHPDDVASLVAYLCSPAGEHLHGQVLHLNGGQHYAG